MPTTSDKSVDCVEMKRRCQQRFMADWAKHKNEYASMAEFLNDTKRWSAEVRELRRKLGLEKRGLQQ